MKLRRPARTSSAFTLIELLVVISIIAVLASMAFPVVTGVMERARRVRTLAMIKDLQVGIKGYQTEYNRYPISGGGNQADPEIKTTEGEPLIPILMGNEKQSAMNGRGIPFIELQLAKNGRGGLIGKEAESYGLADEWGNPFNIIMDGDGNGRVRNPDTNNEDKSISGEASQELPMGVAIYSFGPDGIKKKDTPTKDDITSWRN